MPACSVPQRTPKLLVSRAPATGRTAFGRAASAAAAAAAWSAVGLRLRGGGLLGVPLVAAGGQLSEPLGGARRR